MKPTTENIALPTFIELAENKLSCLNKSDKIINIKISKGTAQMMVEKENAEHAAMCAAAEVLRRIEKIPHFDKKSVESTRKTKIFAGRNQLADDIRKALASLAALRAGKGAQ